MCLSAAPRSDLIPADLFSRCLICQTRSKDLVTFYRDSLRQCLRTGQTLWHTHTHKHSRFYLPTPLFYPPFNKASLPCIPHQSKKPTMPFLWSHWISWNSRCDIWLSGLFGLFGPKLIKLNHLPRKKTKRGKKQTNKPKWSTASLRHPGLFVPKSQPFQKKNNSLLSQNTPAQAHR